MQVNVRSSPPLEPGAEEPPSLRLHISEELAAELFLGTGSERFRAPSGLRAPRGHFRSQSETIGYNACLRLTGLQKEQNIGVVRSLV